MGLPGLANSWDAQTARHILAYDTDGYLLWVFSADFAAAVAGQQTTGKIVLLDTTTGQQLAEFNGASSSIFDPPPVFSLDGAKLLMVDSRGMIGLWNPKTGAELRAFSAPDSQSRWGYPAAAAFSSDGTKALAGFYNRSPSQPGGAVLWETETGAVLQTFTGHRGAVISVGFSPDGISVLTGSDDYTARLWSSATGAELRSLTGHTGSVAAVAYSPDGKTILTGSSDATAKLWVASAGLELRTFSGHTGDVSSVAFSRDGTMALTGSFDSTARLWNAHPALADLALSKTASPAATRTGEDINYSLTVMNKGPDAATGTMMVDTLPLSLTLISASASQGSCSGARTITCDIGNLASGASASITIAVRPTAAGQVTNTADVIANEPDTMLDNNTASAVTSIERAPPTPTPTISPTAPPTSTSTPTRTSTLRSTPSPTSTQRPTSTTTRPPQPTNTRTASMTQSPSRTPTVRPCVGDCNGNKDVTVNELITMVGIALGSAPLSACTAGDADRNGQIAINEIITGVNNALDGCALRRLREGRTL